VFCCLFFTIIALRFPSPHYTAAVLRPRQSARACRGWERIGRRTKTRTALWIIKGRGHEKKQRLGSRTNVCIINLSGINACSATTRHLLLSPASRFSTCDYPQIVCASGAGSSRLNCVVWSSTSAEVFQSKDTWANWALLTHLVITLVMSLFLIIVIICHYLHIMVVMFWVFRCSLTHLSV